MIKLIALLTMVIDHVGYFFFPDQLWIRCIGRISMPLFAHSIAYGYIKTKEKATLYQYIFRMFLFAFISQLPYSLMFNNCLNIGFTWLFTLIFIFLYEVFPSGLLGYIYIFARLNSILPFDYGVYGILIGFIFFIIQKQEEKPSELISAFLLLLAYLGYYLPYNLNIFVWIQSLSILAVPIITFLLPYDHYIKLPKWFTYSFYSIHILLFSIISACICV